MSTRCKIIELPAELQLIIYELVFADEIKYYYHDTLAATVVSCEGITGSQSALTRVNRQIRKEALQVYFAQGLVVAEGLQEARRSSRTHGWELWSG